MTTLDKRNVIFVLGQNIYIYQSAVTIYFTHFFNAYYLSQR